MCDSQSLVKGHTLWHDPTFKIICGARSGHIRVTGGFTLGYVKVQIRTML